MTKNLNDIAFRIHIDPSNTIQHAAKLDTLIKILKNIRESYNNFIEAEFLKNPEYKNILDQDNTQLNKIKEELELLVTDMNIGSAELAMAPAFEEKKEMFKNLTDKWEKKTFNGFKKNVLNADYDDIAFIKKIEKRYTDKERYGIYQPIFACVDDTGGYKLNLKDKNRKVYKTILKPKNQFMNIFTPLTKPYRQKTELVYARIYAKIKKGGKAKKDIQEILSLDEIMFDISPYKPDMIKYEHKIYVLNTKINSEVTYEENNFIIRNDEFDITVWGQTREKAEEAFAFTFDALYTNYALEKDENLSVKAISLKNKLKSIIKEIR